MNYDVNLYKTVDLILVERIKKTLVSTGSWQNFKLKIVAKRDLSEQAREEWMLGFYKNHMRLDMLEITKV